LRRWIIFLSAALALSAVVLVAFPAPALTYEAVVVFHIVGGAALMALALPTWKRLMAGKTMLERVGWSVLLGGGALGVALLFTGALRNDWPLLYTHEVVSALAIAVLLSVWLGHRGWLRGSAGKTALRFGVCLIAVAAVAGGAWWQRTVPWQHANTIHNPAIAPANMYQEGAGPKSPFFPSSAETANGKPVPASYFLDSSSCKQCHADIYRQWESSAHHYSSFNNQWYRQSIVYMQQVDGVQSSKWCAGCHDPALFLANNFNRPMEHRLFTPAAQAGMPCVFCHSIRQVHSTMGNGDYVFQFPPLSRLADSKNPVLQHVVDYLIYEDPEPHRRTFMKPFMQKDPAYFCSTCHKVHLDVPVNNYRWSRGFDDYDNWQASGISGMGARSFYYPAKPLNCVDCHMPLVRSNDDGNVHGYVHSHRFIAANTALPFVNKDKVQLEDTEHFLEDGKVSVDIFAVSPDRPLPQVRSRLDSGMREESTFASGEEVEMKAPLGAAQGPPPAPWTAPLNRMQAKVRAGDTVRVDVVVRTIGVGHFFPGGTVDAFDCWLELKAVDDAGHVLFWSGMVEDNGKGPVEPGAQFYRSLAIDAHGNPINKRNAWAARASVYVHLIPPGAADTVHFRLHVPKNLRGHIHLEAKLNYRKFAWGYTQWAFAGVMMPTGPHDVTKNYDDRRVVYTGNTSDVSGKIKHIPNLPIVTMASDKAVLTVVPASAPRPAPEEVLLPADWQRWNDYGIGLFLQGDLKAAEAAFLKVTQIVPASPEGWVNVGRVRLLAGNLAGAKTVLEKALKISPKLPKANYFYARVLRQMGDYNGSIAHLRVAAKAYPHDRVVHNDLGRVLFLQHKYAAAAAEFHKALAIDPENLEANYNLMLCSTGLGDHRAAAQYEERFLRFKANEASQAITGPYLKKHPDDNRERQPIHEHDSVPLPLAQATMNTTSISRGGN